MQLTESDREEIVAKLIKPEGKEAMKTTRIYEGIPASITFVIDDERFTIPLNATVKHVIEETARTARHEARRLVQHYEVEGISDGAPTVTELHQ